MRLEEVENEMPFVPEIKEAEMFYIAEIPSKYKLYPEGTKIYGRPLKVREVKKLSSITQHNFSTIIKEVLSAAIKGIAIDEILTNDKLFIIFWLRASTYKNSNFVSSYHCEHCGKKEDYKFDVDQFEINYLADDFDSSMTLNLLNKKHKIELDFSRIKDEDRIEAFQERNKDSLGRFDDETVTIASMIKAINGKKPKLREACEYVMDLDAEDYAYLRSYILSIDFGIDNEIEAICKGCGGRNSVQITFRPEFFLPTYKL